MEVEGVRMFSPAIRAIAIAFVVLAVIPSSLDAQGTGGAVSSQGIITTIAGSTPTYRPLGTDPLNAPLGSIQSVDTSSNNIFFVDSYFHLLLALNLSSGSLSVVAGNGIAGYTGDGGLPQNAQLNQPTWVRVSPKGPVFIADSGNFRIRVVANNVISTVIGNGARPGTGGNGDGGPAVAASINNVNGMTFDSSGALYFADGNSIRKIFNNNGATANMVITIAGPNCPVCKIQFPTVINFGFLSGIAYDNTTGYIYASDQANNQIWRFKQNGAATVFAGTGTNGYSGDGGPAASAQISGPTGIWVDASGNVFFVDSGNNAIREITAAGTINTLSGGIPINVDFGDGGPASAAGFAGLTDLAVDSSGKLYLADAQLLRAISNGAINRVAGSGAFSFGGDGGPATSAYINSPISVVTDAAGNLYIPDFGNNRVRKVDTNGNISTIAGTGAATSTGDGGPAVNATLRAPTSVALDPAGNLYVSDLGQRIRKIALDGTISTIAGNGTAGSTGDGGAATSATVNFPAYLISDAQGNLYFIDYAGNRVRKINTSGVISTVAGNGQGKSSGDNGAATNAGMSPTGIAISSNGTIYVADSSAQSIRQVSASGTITTLLSIASLNRKPEGLALDAAGNLYTCFRGNDSGASYAGVAQLSPAGALTAIVHDNPTGFSGDGGPAFNAQARCSGLTVDGGGNLLLADTDNMRVRKISAIAATVAVSPGVLNFSVPQGAAPSSSIQVSGTAGIVVQASAATVSGGSWLSVTPSAGQVPVTLTVAANTQGLAAGSYQGTVTVQVGTTTSTVNVSLTVTAAPAGHLTLLPAKLTFQASSTLSITQAISIGNTGGTSLAWTAAATTTTGGNWLTLGATSGTATMATASTVNVTANPQGLSAGVYTGTITVTPPTGSVLTTSVQFVVEASGAVLTLSQTGLQINGYSGGLALSNGVFVENSGSATLNWTANVVSGSWLNISPKSGFTGAHSGAPPTLQVQANGAGLAVGVYYGLIQVSASGATNSPQYVSVVFNVATAPKITAVYPQGLILAGFGAPAQASVTAYTSSPFAVQANVSTQVFGPTAGASWLSVSPSSVTLAPVAVVTITMNPAGLTPGLHIGKVTFVPSDGSPAQDVTILFLAFGSSNEPQSVRAPAGASCTPSTALMVVRELNSNFTSNAAWPVSLEAQVADDCGNPLDRATVVATFSNGDAPLALADVGSGIFSATWKPGTPAATVGVTIQALNPPLASAITTINGQVTSNPLPPPLVPQGGVVNGASFASGADLAPGSIISVFGSSLASSNGNQPSGFPLPTLLGGIKLSIGGIDAPLFYAGTGQVNAQVPFEVTPGSTAQLVPRAISSTGVEVDGVPETIAIGAAHPGIFIAAENGAPNQGAILNAANAVVDSTNPISAGGVIVIFATGLGATTPPGATGQAGVAGQVANAVSVTIGGVAVPAANVAYAGPAPGYVGLYQINATVPTGVPTGSTVPVVITQNGVASNQATIAVK